MFHFLDCIYKQLAKKCLKEHLALKVFLHYFLEKHERQKLKNKS